MDGSHPVKITQVGDHQVVHLPAGVSVPQGAVLRQDGVRLIIEPASRSGSVRRLLDVLATLAPVEDRLEPISDAPPRPVLF